MTTKVRQYDMQSGWMKKWATPEERENYILQEKYFILQGPNGVILSYDHEGVHYILKDVDEKFELSVYDKPKNGGIPLLPTGFIKVPIKEMLEFCDSTEHEAKDMVRVFGSRLDSNWHYLRQNMKKIGLNLKEYNMSRRDSGGY